jgi:hypothetical protein
MKYDWKSTDTYWVVDQENNMMVSKNTLLDKNNDRGKGDSIGKNLISYFAYKDKRFVEGVKNCWEKIETDSGYYYRGHRYPTPDYFSENCKEDNGKCSFSRDHTSNSFVLMKLANENEWLKEVSNNINWTISENIVDHSRKKVVKHNFTISLWSFVKIFANKWWAKPLFYLTIFIELILYNILNSILYLLGGFSKEYTQEEYVVIHNKIRRQKQSKWRQSLAKLMYPVFSLQHIGWQLYVLDNCFIKRLLQYMSYFLIPRYNYYLKLLFNVGKIYKSDIMNYKSMTGGRWTTVLNELNDRDVKFIDETLLEFNDVDKDILIALWYENKNLY